MWPRQDALITVRAFQSHVEELREAREPIAARLTIWMVAAALIAAVALASTAKVDRVVTSSAGKIISSKNTLVFQALDPSIIKSIKVKEGERVASGQVLATLDPTFAAADVGQYRDQIASLDAQIARDVAEESGRPPEFSPSPQATASPQFKQDVAMQQTLYNQQEKGYAAQMASYDAKVKVLNATIAKLDDDIGRYRQREAISKEIETMRQRLEATGAGSKLNLLTATDQDLEMLRTLDFDQNSLAEARHQLGSAQADREAFIEQWRAGVEQDLVRAHKDREGAVEQLKEAARHLELVRLVAPSPSVVLSIANLSVGSVLKQGDELMQLVPVGAPMEAEVHILARDIGFLSPGDDCTLKIDSFNYMEYGTADGKVEWISDGAFTSNESGVPTEPYYKARIKIGGLHFRYFPPNFRLLPGMTLTADVHVGKRSIAAYLFDTVTYRASTAFREP